MDSRLDKLEGRVAEPFLEGISDIAGIQNAG